MQLSSRLHVSAAAVFLALALSANLSAATVYTGALSGANEVPVVSTTATGYATVTLNGDTLSVFETYSGLTGAPTGAHIHCCGAIGVNEPVAVPFTNFPTGTSGTYSNTFDLTLTATYTSAFLSAYGGTASTAEAALIAGLNSFQTYANIHDSNNPGGEIRSQLQITPEPASAALFLVALAPLGWLFYSSRKSAVATVRSRS